MFFTVSRAHQMAGAAWSAAASARARKLVDMDGKRAVQLDMCVPDVTHGRLPICLIAKMADEETDMCSVRTCGQI